MSRFDNQKTCTGCNRAFNFFTLHKYPCFACGRPFCHACAGNYLVLTQNDLVEYASMAAIKDPRKAHRCCGTCFNRVNRSRQQQQASAAHQTVHEKFQFGNTLGEGGFGVVKECFSNVDGSRVAIKVINRAKLDVDDEASIFQEARVMQRLNHPNIVKMFDFYEEPQNFYMVLECIEGGELFDRIVKKTVYNEKEARDLVVILLNAIKYMHDRNIVHRDLKPENLLLTSNDDDADIKVVDFGFAIEAQGLTIEHQCGTPGYIAPEILLNHKYGKPVDMWAFGVILYILLGGYPPFHDNDQKKLFKKIIRGAYQFHDEYWSNISSEAKDLIRGLLILNPLNRLTVDQALEHPWVRSADNKLLAKTLDTNLAELKKFQATKKLKAGVKAIMAMNKLRRLAMLSSATSLSSSMSAEDDVDIPHTLEARYDLGRLLGEGGYAVVKEGISKMDQTHVAVKIVNRLKMDKAHENALRYEVELMKSLNHPNVVRAFDFFEEKENFFVVMELIQGGELFDRIVRKTCYTEGEARELARVLLRAIKYLHDQNVVHRDLKPENLLLLSENDDFNIKVVDFGFAARAEGNVLTQHCGTPGYIAPEILRNEHYGKSVDMWSFGVILYILLGGYPPFYDKSNQVLYRKILKGAYQFHVEYWSEVSDLAKDLIRKLLVLDPKVRLTVDQALAHPWLQESNEILSQRALNSGLTQLRRFTAKRKLRAGIKAIIMVNRMKNLMKHDDALSAEDVDVGQLDDQVGGTPHV